MKTGILTFQMYHGKKDIGSSRIRGEWIVNNWEDCELFRYGAHYDVVIYQKAYFVEHAKAFKGLKILDLCDPDWLSWTGSLVEMLQEVHAVSCSSMELSKAVQKFTDKPVYFIPDRIDLSIMPPPKAHIGPTKVAVWFGYSQNFPLLDSSLKALMDRNLELIVISDNVYVPPAAFKIKLTNYPFSGENYLKDIQTGDIVINPRYTKGKWKYKSENKTALSWALGIPVAHDEKELDLLMTEEQRQSTSKLGYEKVVGEYDVKLSVIDYKDIIEDLTPHH
jgi:hypothetical protein